MGERSSAVTALAWLLVLAWAALIWRLGRDDLSRDETAGWLLPLLHTLLPWLGERVLEALHFGIRKSAHAFEYGVFALLFWWATLRSWPAAGVRAAALALLAVLLLASADEWRQTGSSTRSGSAADAVIDLAGASIALAGARCWPERWRLRWSPR